MRTHAEPVRPKTPAAAGPTRLPGPDARPVDPGAAPAALTVDDVLRLQARAGNRATVQRLRNGVVVQRALDSSQAAALAERLHDAMEGLGTDEDAVYGALTSRTSDEITDIRDAYYLAYDRSLIEDIEDEFSGDELAKVRGLLAGRAAPETAETASEMVKAELSWARDVAQQLVDAMRGAGTEEAQIFNALEGRTPDEIAEIRRQYFALTGRSLDRDLRDDLSGEDLDRALALVNSSASGSFRNEFEEYLTEDYHASGTGIWEWEIADGKFLVHVGVQFMPDPGVDPPILLWQTQIRETWNRFALTANGGTAAGGVEYPIEFDLQNQTDAERTVRVKQNQKKGEYGGKDRAFADLWYPVMRPTIAPHEFGHLVGLPDEYERTKEDFEAVTEQKLAPPGEETAEDRRIADDLHTALFLDERFLRAKSATAVCDEAGLIVGGAAKQGPFAQRVMRAYNAAYEASDGESLLHAIRYRCEEDSYWTLISVFSYTSSTIMGDESDHTHPVEPRHLKFVASIARERFPDITWGLRLLR